MNNEKAWLGIDPGKSGSLCVMSKYIIDFFDWPESDSPHEVAELIRSLKLEYNIRGCMLEKVSSMPKQGVKSMFTFGNNLGRWESLLAAFEIPFQMPTPQKWQKAVGITKSDGPDSKSRTFNVCRRMFPGADIMGRRGGIKDGRVDALLLAHFASKEFV